METNLVTEELEQRAKETRNLPRLLISIIFYWIVKSLCFLVFLTISYPPKACSLEDRHFGLILMKFGLFGWSNKKLVQTPDDLEFIEKRLADSDFTNSKSFKDYFGFYFLFIKLIWEFNTLGIYPSSNPEQKDRETLRGLSVRLTWFDLVKSLVTFDTPFLLFAKLGRTLRASRWGGYDPKTNKLDGVVTRLFTVFIFLPSLLGYSIYSFYYDPYEGIWYVPMVLYDFFWYFGNIIWIPQICLHKILGETHEIVADYMFYKFLRLFEQTVCVAYCLYSGLFWLVAKHHPAVIAGQLVDALVCLALCCQLNSSKKMNNKELYQVVGDKDLPDLVVSCGPSEPFVYGAI